MKVNINMINKVKAFVQIANSVPADVTLKSGRYSVDAKSIMGVFSLNLTDPLEVVVETDDPDVIDAFKEKAKDFIVED